MFFLLPCFISINIFYSVSLAGQFRYQHLFRWIEQESFSTGRGVDTYI